MKSVTNFSQSYPDIVLGIKGVTYIDSEVILRAHTLLGTYARLGCMIFAQSQPHK